MSVIKAFGDGNALDHSPNQAENTGPDESGYLGYVQMPFPSQMPARNNAAISGTGDIQWSMVNQGTSATAYGEQEMTISSESGGGDDQEVTGK